MAQQTPPLRKNLPQTTVKPLIDPTDDRYGVMYPAVVACIARLRNNS